MPHGCHGRGHVAPSSQVGKRTPRGRTLTDQGHHRATDRLGERRPGGDDLGQGGFAFNRPRHTKRHTPLLDTWNSLARRGLRGLLGSLENCCTGNRTGGSNPSPSALSDLRLRRDPADSRLPAEIVQRRVVDHPGGRPASVVAADDVEEECIESLATEAVGILRGDVIFGR